MVLSEEIPATVASREGHDVLELLHSRQKPPSLAVLLWEDVIARPPAVGDLVAVRDRSFLDETRNGFAWG